MKNYVVAHDLGTTGNKATLYDAERRLVGSVFCGYVTEYAHPRWAEQNPEDQWKAVCTSTHQLLEQTGVGGDDVACITFKISQAEPLKQCAFPGFQIGARGKAVWTAKAHARFKQRG